MGKIKNIFSVVMEKMANRGMTPVERIITVYSGEEFQKSVLNAAQDVGFGQAISLKSKQCISSLASFKDEEDVFYALHVIRMEEFDPDCAYDAEMDLAGAIEQYMGTKRFGSQKIYMLQYICVNKGNKQLDKYVTEDIEQEPPRRIRLYAVANLGNNKAYILQSTDKKSVDVLDQLMQLSDTLTKQALV